MNNQIFTIIQETAPYIQEAAPLPGYELQGIGWGLLALSGNLLFKLNKKLGVAVTGIGSMGSATKVVLDMVPEFIQNDGLKFGDHIGNMVGMMLGIAATLIMSKQVFPDKPEE